MKKYGGAICICLHIFLGLPAQQLPDLSKSKTYNDSIHAFTVYCDKQLLDENYKSLLHLSEQGLSITKPGDDKNISLFYFFKAVGYYFHLDSSIFYYEKSKEYALKAKDTSRILEAEGRLLDAYNSSVKYTGKQDTLAAQLAQKLSALTNDDLKQKILSPLSNYYNQRGLYENQVNSLLQQVELLKARQKTASKNIADSANIGVAYYNLGDIYLLQNNSEKAKQYYLASQPYFFNYQLGLAYFYKGMADAFLLDGDAQKAISQLDSLDLMAKKGMEDAWPVMLMVQAAIANYYIEKGNTSKAESFLQRVQTTFNKHPDESIEPELNFLWGKYFTQIGKYEDALPYLQNAEAFRENIGVEKKLSLLQVLSNCYAGLGHWQKAYGYYAEYAPLRDSVYKIASKQSIANAEAIYQTKEKQQQIESQKLQLDYNKTQQIAFVAGLFFLGLVIFFLVIIYRNKKRTADLFNKQNQQLSTLNTALTEANQTKAKLFGIISHDLRSPINQVYQFLRLQQMQNVQLDEAQQTMLNKKVQTAAGSLLESMEDLLLWSKTQMNNFEPKVHKVNLHELVEECTQLLQLNIDAKGLTVTKNIPENLTWQTDAYFMQTIVRNLLQNAIKASPENNSISISCNQNTLFIENNGSPFTQAAYEEAISSEWNNKGLSGLGLKIVAELSEKINATIKFSSNADFTTRAQIMF